MKSPFKFLDPYTAKDKRVFFGRERETEELYQKLMMTSLLLVYGLSGAGKTSLVRCGLAKRFRGPDWYPLYIRRGEDINRAVHQALKERAGASDEDRYESDLEEVYERLSSNDEETAVKIAEPQQALSVNLAAAIDRLYAKHLRPIYLIFDQFEEIFTLGSEDEQRIFAENLRDLINGDLPCKIILVMREEYIGYLYYFEEVLPEINDFRIRVETMEDKRIAEVIRKSCAAFNITLEDEEEVPALIIEKLRGEKNAERGPRSRIQLPYLQVYLDGLYQQVLAESHPATSKLEELPEPLPKITFTAAQVEAYGDIENVLGDFLDSQMKRIQAAVKTAFPLSSKDAVKEVLDQFVTVDGTKRPLYPDEIDASKLKPEVVHLIVEELLEARILRPDGERFELAHDALAFRISSQRSEEEKRFKEIVEFLQTKYDQYKRKLTGRLTAHEVALVRSHPKPQEIKEKLNRSEWQFFKRSENQVLLHRFMWIIGIVAALFLFSIGGNVFQGIKISKQQELMKRQVDLENELNIIGNTPIDTADMRRLKTLVDEDNTTSAVILIDSILAALHKPDPSTPTQLGNFPSASDEPEDARPACELLIEDTNQALKNAGDSPCQFRDTFEAFQEAYENDRCDDFVEMETIWESIQKQSAGYIEEAVDLSLSSGSDQEEIKALYRKAGCLLPLDEEIQGFINEE